MSKAKIQQNVGSPNLSQRKGIPDGWREVRLGDVCQKISDGLHGTPIYSNGDYFFINGNNIVNGKIVIKQDTKRVDLDEFKKYKKELNENTILLSINGTIGNLALYRGEKCILGKSVAYLNVKNNTSKKFLYYLMLDNRFQSDISINANGSTIKNVSLAQLRNYSFIFPPLPEQKAIAEVLSSLDDKIDLLHRQNKTLEDMAQALFRKWFIEEAKEDWEEKKIGEVLETKLGGTPSTSKSEYWNGDVPWINSGEINKFRISEPTKYITKLGLEKSATKLLPKGSTVIAITGATLGQVSLLEIDTCANQSVVGIIPNNHFSREFVYLWIKKIIGKLIANQTGGAQQHINKNDINNSLIIVPPKKLLAKRDFVFKDIFNKISKNVSQIRTLEKLRDTLLPKLMSGAARVKFN